MDSKVIAWVAVGGIGAAGFILLRRLTGGAQAVDGPVYQQEYPNAGFNLPGNFNAAGPGLLSNLGPGLNLTLEAPRINSLSIPGGGGAPGGAGGGGAPGGAACCDTCAVACGADGGPQTRSSSFSALVDSILKRNPNFASSYLGNIQSVTGRSGLPVSAEPATDERTRAIGRSGAVFPVISMGTAGGLFGGAVDELDAITRPLMRGR